ncbi:MAG: alpha/beta hydrolase [Prevotella sp.]|jgi:acetyl esterase/lipase|nr:MULTISPECIES: alpha/beta hydrolase [unclassified Prevotella]MCH3985905.1 alpha/beta hydrolase [Prevotella sp.]MCH3991631.1 alpha/beta hydrolase [Prevotella sp.]MCH4018796.1 alpha/beta hydrolase [Prevotella sp.]MCH4099588.1 alpha/beta hydrolase [Prevotella sp.]MCH4185294.1 alpha/beta hydrolase [Prevotella sp.]
MKMTLRRILLFVAILMGLGSCAHLGIEKTNVYANTRPGSWMKVITDVPYKTVDDSMLRLDIYSLEKDTVTRRPVLVYIHGGSWIHGDKSWIEKDYRQALLEAFLRAHYAVVSIDYRLADGKRRDALTELSDCRDALDWISRNAGKYHLDAHRMGLWGTSAGAHLALVLGSEPHSSGIRFILDDYGPTDLNGLFRTGLSPLAVSLIRIVKPDLVHERELMLRIFANGNTDRLSPVNRIHKGMPPVLISHGGADKLVPVKQAYELEKQLKAKDIPYLLRIYPGEGHGLNTLTISQVSDLTKCALSFAARYNR